MKNVGKTGLNLAPLPKSASITKIEIEVKRMEKRLGRNHLSILSEAWLQDRYGVTHIDDLLDEAGAYAWVDHMRSILGIQEN